VFFHSKTALHGHWKERHRKEQHALKTLESVDFENSFSLRSHPGKGKREGRAGPQRRRWTQEFWQTPSIEFSSFILHPSSFFSLPSFPPRRCVPDISPVDAEME